MPFFILSVIIQVALVVHVIKTGRATFWVFIVLFFPLVGSLAYLVVELLPEWSRGQAAQKARRSVAKAINPDADLHAASKRLAVADTVQNARVLAEQYLERGQFGEARDLYQRFLKGVHADDPVLLVGLARAQFGLGDHAGVIRTLETLKEKHPGSRSPEAHLLYARATEQLGNLDAAAEEYEALRRYYPGPEPTCRLALILKARGEADRARDLFQRVVAESEVAGRHYNTVHREWVELARKG